MIICFCFIQNTDQEIAIEKVKSIYTENNDKVDCSSVRHKIR